MMGVVYTLWLTFDSFDRTQSYPQCAPAEHNGQQLIYHFHTLVLHSLRTYIYVCVNFQRIIMLNQQRTHNYITHPPDVVWCGGNNCQIYRTYSPGLWMMETHRQYRLIPNCTTLNTVPACSPTLDICYILLRISHIFWLYVGNNIAQSLPFEYTYSSIVSESLYIWRKYWIYYGWLLWTERKDNRPYGSRIPWCIKYEHCIADRYGKRGVLGLVRPLRDRTEHDNKYIYKV